MNDCIQFIYAGHIPDEALRQALASSFKYDSDLVDIGFDRYQKVEAALDISANDSLTFVDIFRSDKRRSNPEQQRKAFMALAESINCLVYSGLGVLDTESNLYNFVFSPDGQLALSCPSDNEELEFVDVPFDPKDANSVWLDVGVSFTMIPFARRVESGHIVLISHKQPQSIWLSPESYIAERSINHKAGYLDVEDISGYIFQDRTEPVTLQEIAAETDWDTSIFRSAAT